MYKSILAVSTALIFAFLLSGCDIATTSQGVDKESGQLSTLRPQPSSTQSKSTTSGFFQGFEENTDGWFPFNGTLSRVSSGTNGIASAGGAWHAEFGFAGQNGGPFTRWGGYNSSLLTSNDYRTSTDVYLDADEGFSNDTRFDYTSAVSEPDVNLHRRDFVFNCGFYNDNVEPGTGSRFICSASNNAFRSSTFPRNPGKDPVVVTTESGWFTFEHKFYDDGSGVLAVDLSIYDGSGNLVKTWTLSDPTDIIGDTVGGNRYGWFPSQEFAFLAVDNTERADVLPTPENKDDCKDGGWKDLVRADGSTFKNQGDCIQYVNTGK